jgi:hypothetical protein
MTDSSVTRELGTFELHDYLADAHAGARRWLARSQNFFVEWLEARQADVVVDFDSDHETMVLVFGAQAVLSAAGVSAQAPPRSVCILPPGRSSVRLGVGGQCAVLASQRGDLGARVALNQQHFLAPDPRITPATPAFRSRNDQIDIKVIPIDSFAAPASNPRLKMLQSATLSINWVEYAGLRDRSALSPHSHADLEQGSLGVAGHFVHHLRESWGKNADLWREDRHIELASPSLMVVPVNLIHTSEGVRAEHHLLIDIFSPPRRDFIAKGWVQNAGDYIDPVPK